MFGIDFTSVGSITYKYFEDIEHLMAHPDVSIYTKHGEMSILDDLNKKELKYSTIIIEPKNKIFKKLTIGCKLDKEFKRDYIILELSIAENGGHNLKPLTLQDYKKKIDNIKKYILEEYKILLNFEKATFRSLEINKTMKLDYEIKEYKKILMMMADFAPKRYEQQLYKAGNRSINGIILFNKSQEYKLYDKTEQIKKVYKIKIEGNYLRVEIGLLNPKKIKEVFGTTIINEITEEQLKEYYVRMVEKDLLKKFDKYIKDSNRELLRVAKSEQEKDIKKWVRGFFLRSFKLKYKLDKENEADIDLLFDTQQCLDIIKKYTKKNYARAYRNIKADDEESKEKKNNLAKYNEIREKLFNFNEF